MLLLALARSLGWLEKKEFKKNIKVGESSESNATVKGNLEVTLKQLVYATGNFSYKNKIGSDYLGTVYKAYLEDHKVTVAVKKFFPRHKGKIHGSIAREIYLLKVLEGGNFVRLLDVHIGESLQLCIYECVESLETALFKSKEKTIPWEKRYKICRGIAAGLASLHQHTKMVHGNLECSNILLDKEYNPKLSGFGNASIYNDDDDKLSVIKQDASRNYLAPEYFQADGVSVKTDIYSFGVILLEIVAGHRNKEMYGLQEYSDLVNEVHLLFQAKIPNVSAFIDKMLKDDFNTEEVERVLRLALFCTSLPSLRPGITDIFIVLNGGKTVDAICPIKSADQPTNGVKITSASSSSK